MEIKILGKTYSIRTEFDERFTNQTADLVNGKMHELAGKVGPGAPEKIAVLAAMNFAGELLKLRREEDDRRTLLRQKASQVIKLIDSQR
ncbi:MAG: cell division protein ZapA [Pseudomonadota bacterium]